MSHRNPDSSAPVASPERDGGRAPAEVSSARSAEATSPAAPDAGNPEEPGSEAPSPQGPSPREWDPEEPTPAQAGKPTPDMIERMRHVGLRIDRAGRLWHQGREVTHPRLARAIRSWIDRREGDGRPIVRMDAARYAYIEVEDAELLANTARWDGERVILHLNDGSEEELDYGSLAAGEDDALYCAVRGGRLTARLTPRAAYALAPRLDEREDGSFEIVAGGARFPIATRRA